MARSSLRSVQRTFSRRLSRETKAHTGAVMAEHPHRGRDPVFGGRRQPVVIRFGTLPAPALQQKKPAVIPYRGRAGVCCALQRIDGLCADSGEREEQKQCGEYPPGQSHSAVLSEADCRTTRGVIGGAATEVAPCLAEDDSTGVRPVQPVTARWLRFDSGRFLCQARPHDSMAHRRTSSVTKAFCKSLWQND